MTNSRRGDAGFFAVEVRSTLNFVHLSLYSTALRGDYAGHYFLFKNNNLHIHPIFLRILRCQRSHDASARIRPYVRPSRAQFGNSRMSPPNFRGRTACKLLSSGRTPFAKEQLRLPGAASQPAHTGRRVTRRKLVARPLNANTHLRGKGHAMAMHQGAVGS